MKLVVGQLTKQFLSYPPPCSQQPSTGLYRNQMNPVHMLTVYSLILYIFIILPSNLVFPK
jgi:hypothetical protein